MNSPNPLLQFLPAYEDTTNEALGKGVKKSIWHLQLLGTLPEYQKRGIGQALVREKEKRVSELPCLMQPCTEYHFWQIAAEGGTLMCLESEKAANVSQNASPCFIVETLTSFVD